MIYAALAIVALLSLLFNAYQYAHNASAGDREDLYLQISDLQEDYIDNLKNQLNERDDLIDTLTGLIEGSENAGAAPSQR